MPKWPDLFGNTRGAKCDGIKINVHVCFIFSCLDSVSAGDSFVCWTSEAVMQAM
jgi:hypothetical protein